MTETQFKRAEELRAEIKEVKEFIFCISPEVIKSGFTTGKRSAILTKEVTTTFSLFGMRDFGCGKHEQRMAVPENLLVDIGIVAKKWLDGLEYELKNM